MQYLILFLLSLVLPDIALADGLSLTPPAGDKSILLLQGLFPGLFGGGVDAFASSMATFNGGILMLGGILATYTILAGTLGTAHDGEMLGKKFSSVWIPIRYSLGTALVLPIIGGGYNTMQWLVASAVIQSVGLADSVWASFVSSQNLTNIAAMSLQRPEAKQLGYTIFQSLVCQEALRQATSGANSDGVLNSGVKAVTRRQR